MDLDSKNTAANPEKINQLTENIMSSPNNNNFEEKLAQMTAFIEKSTTEASARMTRLEEEQLAASERLIKLESALTKLTEGTAANISSIKELNLAANQMFQVVEVNQRNFEVVQQNFEIIVAQIRGLQNENRNILDHLFGIQDEEES